MHKYLFKVVINNKDYNLQNNICHINIIIIKNEIILEKVKKKEKFESPKIRIIKS